MSDAKKKSSPTEIATLEVCCSSIDFRIVAAAIKTAELCGCGVTATLLDNVILFEIAP